MEFELEFEAPLEDTLANAVTEALSLALGTSRKSYKIVMIYDGQESDQYDGDANDAVIAKNASLYTALAAQGRVDIVPLTCHPTVFVTMMLVNKDRTGALGYHPQSKMWFLFVIGTDKVLAGHVLANILEAGHFEKCRL